MKNKIIYIVVFAAAFFLTTAVIIYMNNQYSNIFKFDFTASEVKPVKEVAESKTGNTPPYNIEELKDYMQNKFRKDLLDSIRSFRTDKKVDTIKTIVKDPALSDSLKRIQSKLNELKSNLASKEQEVNIYKTSMQVKNDSAYVRWKKEMIKIYESMDSKAAARIIQNLSENLARDILFSMKKKKAAEIITRLNPETATRLTRMQ